MQEPMTDRSCRQFAEALAARQPVPGGGGAAAYAGALGAALCAMVARFDEAKKLRQNTKKEEIEKLHNQNISKIQENAKKRQSFRF